MQNFAIFEYFSRWNMLMSLWNFEKSSNMAKNWGQKMKKSLVQHAFNPFFGWFRVPYPRHSSLEIEQIKFLEFFILLLEVRWMVMCLSANKIHKFVQSIKIRGKTCSCLASMWSTEIFSFSISSTTKTSHMALMTSLALEK